MTVRIDACSLALRTAKRLQKTMKRERLEVGRQRTSPSFAAADFQGSGMKGVTRQKKFSGKFRRPAGFDKLKIKILVGPVDLVPYDRVA